MAEILAFAGSNSSTSINYELVKYTASLIENHKVQTLDMARYPFPMYSADEEKQKGFSNSLIEFKGYIQQSQGLILSVNEHNGNPSGYFKNLLDWLSRLERRFLEDTTVFLMAASPGKRGGIGAMGVVQDILPRFGAEIASTFSLPSFGQVFANGEIIDQTLKEQHSEALDIFLQKLN
ncbi:NADPH-dependent FMN reductase [Flagellimonas sp.]|uniref:NADPH-dependent FMN reductase n=1 Tax=Flagellimonas sp. TaxID=2058762 RepID=UPI003F4A11ED